MLQEYIFDNVECVEDRKIISQAFWVKLYCKMSDIFPVFADFETFC